MTIHTPSTQWLSSLGATTASNAAPKVTSVAPATPSAPVSNDPHAFARMLQHRKDEATARPAPQSAQAREASKASGSALPKQKAEPAKAEEAKDSATAEPAAGATPAWLARLQRNAAHGAQNAKRTPTSEDATDCTLTEIADPREALSAQDTTQHADDWAAASPTGMVQVASVPVPQAPANPETPVPADTAADMTPSVNTARGRPLPSETCELPAGDSQREAADTGESARKLPVNEASSATPFIDPAMQPASGVATQAMAGLAAQPQRDVEGMKDARPASEVTALAAGNGIAGNAPRVTSSEPMTSAALPVPVDAPEFKEALAAQVSVFARDGVQHAQLHLNPADMGPIMIKIVTDGTNAQVDFGAESAHTRQLIESGLPELASAMREAGLTLTGGGVSQHAGQNAQGQGQGQPGDQPHSTRRMSVGSADDSDSAPAQRAPMNRPARGNIDLYA